MKTKAAILMLLSAMSFSMMQIVISATADTVPLFEQLFFRNLFAAFIAYIALRKKNHKPFGNGGNGKLLFLRSSFGFLGMVTTFYASGHGEQGDVTTIMKMSPFVVVILSVLFLKEKVSKNQIIALFIAITGAFCVCNPKFQSSLFPIFVAILAAIFAGVAYTMVSALKGKEAPEVIIFIFSAFSVVVTFPIMMMNFIMPTPIDFLLLIMIGLFAAGGQIALTYSYSYANASEVSIYNYSGIVFSMIFGLIFLGEALKTNSIIGGLLVIIAALIAFFDGKKVK